MNLLQAIGHTPLIELMNLTTRPGVRIRCKLEGCNPGGSVKDRPPLSMIVGAEARGELVAGKTILEPRAAVRQRSSRGRHDLFEGASHAAWSQQNHMRLVAILV